MNEADLSKIVAAYREHGGVKPAARALGMERNAFRRRLRLASERGLAGYAPVLPGFAIKSVSSRSPDGAFVKQAKAPGKVFELPAGQRVNGVSALVDADGRELFKWVKTGADRNTPDIIAAIKAAFAEVEPVAEVPLVRMCDMNLLSVYPIADQHNGLLAWGRETGESYDLKIGADRLRACMGRLVAQSPASAEALILNLGDWQHNDNSSDETPRGRNKLDVDGRYFKVLTTGIRLMVDCIEMALRKHARVTVRNLPGNHDPHASIALTVALAARYADNPRVTIDDSPSEWFFHRFGQTLIGAHHGHRAKPDQMAMTMACERREDWGATRYHWILFGHIHHETAREVGDVRVESFQTLASKDAYGAEHGFSSGRSLTSITLHREEGEVGRHRVNAPPPGALPLAA